MSDLSNIQRIHLVFTLPHGPSARVMNNSDARRIFELNIISEPPILATDLDLTGFSYPSINDFCLRRVKVTFESGTLDFSTEISSAGDTVEGFTLVDLRQNEITRIEELAEDQASLFQKLNESFAGAASELVEEDSSCVLVWFRFRSNLKMTL